MTKYVIIYSLIHPITKDVRYIGWSSNLERRYKDHIRDAENNKKSHKCSWIRSLLKDGLMPEVFEIEKVTYEKRNEREIYWISYYGRENLVNSTDGGEGSVGFKFSEESKNNLSKMRTGKKLSEYHRKAISEGKMGDKNPNHMGKSMTKESINKTREKVIGRKRPSHSQSLQGKKRGGSSSYVGVTKRIRGKSIFWEANINIDSKIFYIGIFKTEIEAAKAYDIKAIEMYGTEAKLNFPLDK